ncbi:GNAT family N-acetyltransferase [Vibrio agarivorans]|uniref:GNAT family N-acetyltransferase n=1 Tax=Vibrio agarivorans TaxID=153622 RepID=UPI0025B3F742|nr:GNAT family N-acetyltransferase [Vibrio agarivorans]MDN3659831.1 GNAT family N-acetyltransferase [Vibrio agarivorans]
MDISDYPQVIQLWQGTDAMLLREADSLANIDKYLSHNSGLSFVAETSQEIIGAILVGTDGRRGYVQHLAVKESMRGEGIGASLIDSAVAALSAIGIEKTHLFVVNENIGAQRLYEKLGWFPRDEVRMYSFNKSSNSEI